MKAIVYTEYGSPDVLHLKEIEKPTPKDNEILIKVHANSLNFGDLIARKLGKTAPHEFHMPSLFWLFACMEFGFRKPKKHILGNEFAGEVEAVGKAVTRFKKGDPVFGYRGMNLGANVEYLCVPEDGLVALKPDNVTYEEVVTIPGGALTALSLLRKVNIQPGQKVLIHGASGGIGSHALQLAKYFGAEVTGVCGTPRVQFVKALGADKVIDYTQEDFTRNGETYDLIFDVLGKSSFSRCKGSLKQNGIYLLVSFKMKHVFQMLWTSKIGSKKVICALSSEKPDDLAFIKQLIEAGKIKSVIDRCYPLEQTADAHRYVENGHKRGHVVIRMARESAI
jgi:NADPH:quinone reductase-like Zn-dependent oxidoreductase